MKATSVVLVVGALAIPPCRASEPGQQLRCEDWVAVEPGLAFANWDPPEGVHGPWGAAMGSRSATDVEGRVIVVDVCNQVFATDCRGEPASVLCIRALNGQSEETIAYLRGRCGSRPNSYDYARVDWDFSFSLGVHTCPRYSNEHGSCVSYNAMRGELIFSFESYHDGYQPTYPPPYTPSVEFCKLSGLATLFDVLQSFSSPSALGFSVPAQPEGLRYADRFDSYAGEVTRPLDLSLAQPLQCSFPPTPPRPGDYLEITAPVPTPAPGRANYVLTSATYQGQTRAGRKTNAAGRLVGRDATALPACVIEEVKR